MNLLAQGPITAEDFLRLPEADICELIDGRLVETRMGAESCLIAAELQFLLRTFLQSNPLGFVFPGETSYQFLPGRPNLVRKPDVSFVRQGRFPENRVPEGHIRLAPDLAVEVVSPNDLYYEVEQKVVEYRSGGVRLIWVVSPPTRTILIRRADGSCAEVGENGELSGEDVVPGFRCQVSACSRCCVWRLLLPNPVDSSEPASWPANCGGVSTPPHMPPVQAKLLRGAILKRSGRHSDTDKVQPMIPSAFRLFLAALAAALVLVSVPAFSAEEKTPLKKGDRIVFLGDSITAAGAGANGYVTLIRKALAEKYKDLDLQVIGAGVSGNKVPNLQARLKKDVLARKPTLVVIYIGINDVWHGEKDPSRGTPKDKYEAGLKDIIGQIKQEGGRVLLCTPSVIGEKRDGANTLDSRLDEYSDISRKVARETKVQLCDLRKAFLDHLKEHNPDNKEKGVLTSDRVHLNAAGNRFVADVILKCLTD